MADKRSRSRGPTGDAGAAGLEEVYGRGRHADPAQLPPEEIRALVERLHAQNIQLETENEELRQHRVVEELQRGRYQELFHSSPVGYLVLDSRGLIVSANRTAAGLLGMNEHEMLHMVGLPFRGFIAAPSFSAFSGHWADILRGGPAVCELQMNRRNGDVFWARLESVAGTDPDTGKWVVRAAISDVTGWKELEAERERLLRLVRRRTSELEVVIASISDGIIIYAPSGRVVRMNPAARSMLRSLDEEMLDAGESSGQGEAGGGFWPAELARLALGGYQVPVRTGRLETPAGSLIWVSAGAAPLRTEGGELFGAALALTDVTGLYEAQKQRETMLHTVTHDLRTPLAAISGHSQILQKELKKRESGGPALVSAQTIMENVNRMSRMVQELADAAMLERGPVSFKAQAVDVRALARAFLERIKGGLDAGRVSLDMPEDLPTVVADPDPLERVLGNLVSNALKYSTPASGVELRAAREGGEVVVSVSDEGRGICRTDLPHIFEAFYRGEASQDADGLGLGLFITEKLVRALGGRIWVESEEGRGSTFYFTLPVAE